MTLRNPVGRRPRWKTVLPPKYYVHFSPQTHYAYFFFRRRFAAGWHPGPR